LGRHTQRLERTKPAAPAAPFAAIEPEVVEERRIVATRRAPTPDGRGLGARHGGEERSVSFGFQIIDGGAHEDGAAERQRRGAVVAALEIGQGVQVMGHAVLPQQGPSLYANRG
jgi:hypothetical protein